MVKIDKIYTKSGDQGQTHLIGGASVSKSNIRVNSYGEIDELNACLGLVRSFLPEEPKLAHIDQELEAIQQRLFDLGAQLATPAGSQCQGFKKISSEDIATLEKQIDNYVKNLPALRSFVLPGGHPLNALLHLSRTVCRRAERAIVSLSESEPVPSEILIYVNRLSDYIFSLAREVSRTLGAPEFLWEPKTKS